MTLDPERFDAVTFDCYGTLIDWDTGVANALGPWVVRTGLPVTVADLVGRFAERQHANQRLLPFRGYRSVLRDALAEAVDSCGGAIDTAVLDRFAAGVGSWPAFPDTLDALVALKRLGLHIAVVSNVDEPSFAETGRLLGGLIDTAVTADRVGAYKPDRAMFHALFAALEDRGITRDRILHIAQSRYHDIAPARELGLETVWIDRRHGRPGRGVTIPDAARPDWRCTSLEAFCDRFCTATN